MDVAVSELRSHLSHWLDRARDGDEVVVTDRGVPVARLVGVGTTSTVERLTEAGVISRPLKHGKPKATGRRKPKPKRSVAARVSEQRK